MVIYILFFLFNNLLEKIINCSELIFQIFYVRLVITIILGDLLCFGNLKINTINIIYSLTLIKFIINYILEDI